MGCLRGFATLHAFDFRAFEEPGLPNREWLIKAKTLNLASIESLGRGLNNC